ncbi:MAG: Glutamine-dependent NAD(+) synthetase [bacterium ADurb.Bin400]|nr:MAG: Glutamine-dependent NAD(+) synthetase [bacterium ADurb.Bin400]
MTDNQRHSAFFDVRNHGFFRVAAIIPRVHVANPAANLAEHLKEFRKVYDQGACYAAAPELGLTGYSCGDLFHSEVLQDGALEALSHLLAETSKWDMIITVGVPIAFDGALYNCAVTLHHGQILAITPKSYLPEYREFYERRWFACASELQCDEAVLFGSEVPIIGTRILIRPLAYPGLTIHTEICEDGWVPIPPNTLAALHGATLLVNLSASNDTIGKSEYREQLVLGSSARNLAAQIYVAAGYGESTTDVAWGGDAKIAERGGLLVSSERFVRGGTSIITDIDVPILVQERIRQSSFRQNALAFSTDFRDIFVPGQLGLDSERAVVYNKLLRKVDPFPFVPSDPVKRDARCREVFMIQATSLARRLETLPPHMRKVFVGISGGQDSTQSLLVAAHAMDYLGLPRTNIVGITMPGFGTSVETRSDAVDLIRAVGATFHEIPITELSNRMFDAIDYDPEARNYDTTYENVQAWMRFQVLLAQSSKDKGIVLGTGDLSELIAGWCTMFGDHSSHYNVNGGVPKTLITYLINWAAGVIFANEPEVQAVLGNIVDRDISPELLPLKEGKIAQKTEEKIGPYALRDFFAYWSIRFGFAPSKVARLACQAFDGVYDLPTIKRWMDDYVSRFFDSQFKRNCLPEGPKVGLVCVSPRGDWRMPSDADKALWMADVARIPDV